MKIQERFRAIGGPSRVGGLQGGDFFHSKSIVCLELITREGKSRQTLSPLFKRLMDVNVQEHREVGQGG